MKIDVTFKDPDALIDCITEEVGEAMRQEGLTEKLSDDEFEALKEKRIEAVHKLAGKWFEWGEYLTVEIDTEKETIRVKPVEG